MKSNYIRTLNYGDVPIVSKDNIWLNQYISSVEIANSEEVFDIYYTTTNKIVAVKS